MIEINFNQESWNPGSSYVCDHDMNSLHRLFICVRSWHEQFPTALHLCAIMTWSVSKGSSSVYVFPRTRPIQHWGQKVARELTKPWSGKNKQTNSRRNCKRKCEHYKIREFGNLAKSKNSWKIRRFRAFFAQKLQIIWKIVFVWDKVPHDNNIMVRVLSHGGLNSARINLSLHEHEVVSDDFMFNIRLAWRITSVRDARTAQSLILYDVLFLILYKGLPSVAKIHCPTTPAPTVNAPEIGNLLENKANVQTQTERLGPFGPWQTDRLGPWGPDRQTGPLGPRQTDWGHATGPRQGPWGPDWQTD